MKNIRSLIAASWRLGLPYFKSEDRRMGRMLLAAVIAIELAVVAVNVLINQWNARFYNALQERDWNVFIHELLVFSLLAAAYIVLVVYQLYLNQWLQIRWRKWMTGVYIDRWMSESNHYRAQLLGDAADNPDQRIADDINLFVERTLFIGVRLLGAVVTLISFVAILWALSRSAPLTLFGTTVSIPGYLVWAALVYAVIGTVLTHWIGWPLAALNFRQQRFEADFRFNLVRVRENSEQIALLDGDKAEAGRLGERFRHVVNNFMLVMSRQKKLTFFTTGYSQLSLIFPYVVVSPAYFAGSIQLGGLMQTASAFTSVQDAMSIFITVYRQFAEWAAVIERLTGFDRAIESATRISAESPITYTSAADKSAVTMSGVSLDRPDGGGMVSSADVAFTAGESVLLNGPSGSGKSTLFRAIAGVWPFGKGKIVLPQGARIMILPQRPYFPVTTLAGAITYPAEPGTFSQDQLADVLRLVGLPELVSRLQDEAHWNRMLSGGEQQRLGVARAILQAPDFLFLDEATASLDEASEAALYELLKTTLSKTTVISIGHRSTLAAFHDRSLTLVKDGERHRLADLQLKPAAE